MTREDMTFHLGLIDKLCEHLDRMTEEITELRKESVEATRRLAMIAEALAQLVAYGVR